MTRESDLLEEVLTLARGLKSLRAGQLKRIEERAPKMDEVTLIQLKDTLVNVQKAEKKERLQKLEVLRRASTAHKGWTARKARKALAAQESSDQANQEASAEALLKTLNV